MDQNQNNEQQVNNFIKPKFMVFPSKDKADKYVSDLIINQVKSLPNSNICLSSDDTMIPIYKNLIDSFNNNKISFAHLRTFNINEYVGLSENEFNKSIKSFMDSNLFDHIDINKENTFYPINWNFDVKSNSDYDYVEYDRQIEAAGWLDLIILSVGENGNIGFNEPHSAYESFTNLSQLSDSTKKELTKYFSHKSLVPDYAVTMGIQSILYSRKIILLAFGAKKAEAIYNLFFTSDFFEEWPITSLNYHNDVTILCDAEASAFIMEKRIQ